MSSEKTTNLNLHKWLPADFVRVDEFNDNFEKIDEEVAGVTGQIGDLTAIPQSNIVEALKDKDDKIDSAMAQLAETAKKTEGEVSVTMFTSIDEAVKYAFDNKKKLKFPSGTYTYSPSARQSLNGINTGNFIHWEGDGATIHCTTVDIGFWTFLNMESIKIEGINFVGPAAVGNSPTEFAYCLSIYSAKKTTINKCSFTDFIGDGILITSNNNVTDPMLATRNYTVSNCYFNNNGRGGMTVVSGIHGIIEFCEFGKDRLMFAPAVGAVLHIEANTGVKYAIEDLTLRNNLFYNYISLVNPQEQSAYIGNKDSWIVFDDNKFIMEGDYIILGVSTGNLKFVNNEVNLTCTKANDDVAKGALYISSNNVVLKNNYFNVSGKKTIIGIGTATSDGNRYVDISENTYNVTGSIYLYRFASNANPDYKKVVISREKYVSVQGRLLAVAGQFPSLNTVLDRLKWSGTNCISLGNDHSVVKRFYIKDCQLRGSANNIEYVNGGSAQNPIIYYENTEFGSGAFSANITTYPKVGVMSFMYKSDNTFSNSGTNNVYGRNVSLTRDSIGLYTLNGFAVSELNNYSINIMLNLYSTSPMKLINLRYNTALQIEVRDNSGDLADLVANDKLLLTIIAPILGVEYLSN